MNVPEHEHIDHRYRTVDLRLLASDAVDLISVIEYANLSAREDVHAAQDAVDDVETRQQKAIECGGTETARNRIRHAFDVEIEDAERKLSEAERRARTVSDLLQKVTSAGAQG